MRLARSFPSACARRNSSRTSRETSSLTCAANSPVVGSVLDSLMAQTFPCWMLAKRACWAGVFRHVTGNDSLVHVEANGVDRVRDWAHEQAETYRHGEKRPLGGYLGVLATYGGLVGLLTLGGRLARGRVPERVSVWDVTLLSLATHRLARTIAKDPVTSPLRAPFTTYEGVSAASELHEEVREGHGVQHSVGELLTCPLCLAQWVATVLSAGLVVAPRQTRLVMATLSAVAGADFLQYLYAYLQQATEK
jgi:hypothetical protein